MWVHWMEQLGAVGRILGGSLLVAALVLLVGRPLLGLVVRRTRSRLDDHLLQALPVPLALSVLLVGLGAALRAIELEEHLLGHGQSALMTVAILLWTRVGTRLCSLVIDGQLAHPDEPSLIQPRTLPLFQMTVRVVLFGAAAYLLLIAWNIDVTAWMASAGVVGIAVGFASKDTLANLFAGVFIVADAPYRLGDFLVIDDRTRGRVTHIGLRSTRIVTRDDIELIVPNSLMASARVTNESGGPGQIQRIKLGLQVAYGSDLDRVRAVLDGVAAAVPLLLHDDPERTPRVRFRAFEDAGIRVELLAWIRRPEDRGLAVDALVTRIARAFDEAGIEIPYPQRVVHLRPAPSDGPPDAPPGP
jgi:MscS family membrane protein